MKLSVLLMGVALVVGSLTLFLTPYMDMTSQKRATFMIGAIILGALLSIGLTPILNF